MKSYLCYTHSLDPREEFPIMYEYTATMYRNEVQEIAQDGHIYCCDRDAAEGVITDWNEISRSLRSGSDSDVVWKYTLKGKETSDQATE